MCYLVLIVFGVHKAYHYRRLTETWNGTAVVINLDHSHKLVCLFETNLQEHTDEDNLSLDIPSMINLG